MSYAIYDEAFYLANNADVRAAVAAGAFASGLEHFQKFGFQEGRLLVSPEWNEAQYLAANPDVNNAVTAGFIRSGLQHFILHGEAEGRRGAPVVTTSAGFNEEYYASLYPEVGAAVAAGIFKSPSTHFIRNGIFEDRVALFSGTNGHDIVTGYGSQSLIAGVALDTIANRGNPDVKPTSFGLNEIDLLVGGPGVDNFLLSVEKSAVNPTAQRFYVGGGNSDYAYIRNYDATKDYIQLAGTINDYVLTAGAFALTNNRASGVSISTNTGDLVALVEGVQSLQVNLQDTNAGVIFLV